MSFAIVFDMFPKEDPFFLQPPGAPHHGRPCDPQLPFSAWPWLSQQALPLAFNPWANSKFGPSFCKAL